MRKTYLSVIIDYVLLGIFSLLLLFSWVRFYTHSLAISIIVGIMGTAIVLIALMLIKRARRTKQNLTKKDASEAENIALQLRFSSRSAVLDYFVRLFEERYFVEQKESGLILKSNKDDTCIYFSPAFGSPKVTVSDLTKAYAEAKNFKANQLILAGAELDPDVTVTSKLIKNFKITLLNKYELYQKNIKDLGILPANVVDTSKDKLKFKDIIEYALSPARTKSYAILGLILIFSSFFVIFRIYYLVSGSILLLLACLTRILPRKETYY